MTNSTKATGISKQEYIKELENEGFSTDECICIVTGKTTW